MSTTKLVPREETILGSACSGSDGDKNRTYTLAYSDVYADAGITISVGGQDLIQGASKDFTHSSGVITFLNNLNDTTNIHLSYYTETTTPTFTIESATAYCTTLQVFEYLRWDKIIPNYPNSSTLETVDESGTLASGSVIYLDQIKIIDNTLTLSHGTTASSVTDLTETTHYTIDLSIGQITITASGASEIGTDNVYATYKYNNMITDAFCSDLIDRATKEINDRTKKKFGDLTLVTREEQVGKGSYGRLYRPKNLPVYIAKTQLNGAITTSSSIVR